MFPGTEQKICPSERVDRPQQTALKCKPLGWAVQLLQGKMALSLKKKSVLISGLHE